MDQSHKQRFEQLAFDVLRLHEPDLPAELERHEDNPDFRIATASGFLGIEVTEVDHGDNDQHTSQRRVCAERDRIVQAARDLASDQGLPNIDCTFYFAEHANLQKKHTQDLAKLVVQAVRSRLPTDAPDWQTVAAIHGLPSEIVSVRVRLACPGKRGIWYRSIAYFTDEDCVDAFQSTIDRKNQKVTRYLETCQSCWLVLATTWSMGDLEPGLRAVEHEFHSAFDRLYFVDNSGRHLFRLRSTAGPTQLRNS